MDLALQLWGSVSCFSVVWLCFVFLCTKFTENDLCRALAKYFLLSSEEKTQMVPFVITSMIQTSCNVAFGQCTICLIHYSPAQFHSYSAVIIHISFLLCHGSLLLSAFVPLLRIKQAKVQILPERILPDPLSAVQLTPLSRLHMHPSSKPPSQSCKQAQCWWNNYKQVQRITHKREICVRFLKVTVSTFGDVWIRWQWQES